MEGIYMGELFCTSIVTTTMQVVLYNMFKKKAGARTKYWNAFFGVSIASLIADIVFIILTVVKSYEMSSGLTLVLEIIALLSIGPHLGMFIAGIIDKNKIKDENIRYKKSSVFIVLIAVLIIGVMGAIPQKTITKDDILTDKYSEQIKYLKDKYGDKDFRVTRVIDEYATTGSMQDSFAGRKQIHYLDLEILEPESQTTFTLHYQSGNCTDNFSEKNMMNKEK